MTIRDAGKVPTPWLKAVSKQAQPLREWWRCIGNMMQETASGAASRKQGLQVLLRAAVEASSGSELGMIVDSIYGWADAWRDRDEHLRQAMHA